MHPPPDPNHGFRFAKFEFHPETGQLRSRGRSQHLPEQVARLLEALLRAQGTLIPREELKRLLWPDKTFGDLEGGLNTAMRKLRQALDDDGAEPRLIGTLPKRGYQLLVAVEPMQEAPPGAPAHPPERAAGSPLRRRWARGLLATLAAMAALAWLLSSRHASPPLGRTPGERWNDRASGIEFVWIPPGTFLMGSPPGEAGRSTDENQHQVTISHGFWMGRYEVTQGQYRAVMGTNPSSFKELGPQSPVECVNWEDAQAFLRRLDSRVPERAYRLPTEAEWEYACRAGTPGSAYGPLGSIAWNAYNSGLRPHAVGQKEPNAWGLCDMIGNVYEWCQDCYKDPYDLSVDTDPVGPPTNKYHALRGGSWQSGTTKSRAAYRASEAMFDLRYPFLGFRVVCVPSEAGRP